MPPRGTIRKGDDGRVSNIRLTAQKKQPVLSVRTRTSVEDLPARIGEIYREIMGYLKELEEPSADVPYVAYFNQDMKDLDVEIGVPVRKKLPGKDSIQPGEIAPGIMAVIIHKGPYAKMEGSYRELSRWLEACGHEVTGTAYEFYHNDPNEVAEDQLVTRIAMPIKTLGPGEV